ncbi:MAG: protease modulator HflC [Spirochaetota bacterium]
MKKTITALVILVVLAVVLFLLGPFYILEEGEQSVVTRFGKIINSATTPGLKYKLPVVDSVVKYSDKVLSWDGQAQRIPTRENQFIWVDTTARWEISDPAKFYESVTTMEQGYGRLDDIVDSAVRTIISDNYLIESVRTSNQINEVDITDPVESQTSELEDDADDLRELTETQSNFESISKGRGVISEEMYEYANSFTEEYGIKLIDVLIRQIRYSEDLTESVYDRMIKERNQIAEAYRSYGEGQKAEWRGRLENDQKRILSEAYSRAEGIRGEADADATEIYADSYGADEVFFQFWRTLESYKKSVPELQKTFSTDMEYFDYLHSMDELTD